MAHISLHIPKFRGRHGSKSESHDSSSPDAVTSDGSVSPTLDRGPPIRLAAGSCPGSPTQERHKLAPKRSSDLTSLSAGSISQAVEVIDDSKIRGTSSLKAYSYARPPPPSYRKVGPQKVASSEHPPEAMPVCVTFTGPTTPDTEVAPKFDYDAAAHEVDVSGQPTKPTFASLSEETRLRLLKVSLHQKAMEKKRQSESSSPGLSPTTSHFDASDETNPSKPSDTAEGFGSTEHLSSSNTSRSSSTPSSKTASLDSLHQSTIDNPEGRKLHPTRVTTSGGWKASFTPPQATSTQTTQSSETHPTCVETSQTVVTVVEGKGVKSSEAKRRPSSSDIRARRNTAEGLRPPMQSESSESSSEDEADKVQINMSKTFDEKLKILLDLDYSFKRADQKKGDQDEDSSSLSSEQSRRTSIDRLRRASDERQSLEDIRNSTGSLPVSNSERRPSFEQRQPTRRRVSVDGSENRTTIEIESNPRKSSIDRKVSKQTPPDRRPSLQTTKTVINVDSQRNSSNSSLGNERNSLPTQSKMGRVRTTTPVALKEFKIASATFRKDVAGAASQPRKLAHKDSPIVKTKTEESTITISPSPSPRSSYASSRGSFSDSSPRNSFDESPRNSRSEVSINLSRTQKPSQPEGKPPGKYAAMAARSHHVQPKVMGRESTVKQKTFPRDGGQRRDILPSKGRHAATYKEHGKEKHAHQLETNAQHIADLLDEMHSERLKMMRQRSDISGQAQKAAAQRASSRRRRRSVGDENEPNLKDLAVKETNESKDSLLKTTHDVARDKRSVEQNRKEDKTHQSTNKPLLTHPGNNKRPKDRKK